VAIGLNGGGYHQRAAGKDKRLLILNAVYRVRPGRMCDGYARPSADHHIITRPRQRMSAPVGSRIPVAAAANPGDSSRLSRPGCHHQYGAARLYAVSLVIHVSSSCESEFLGFDVENLDCPGGAGYETQ
jgi:hypothetical protein